MISERNELDRPKITGKAGARPLAADRYPRAGGRLGGATGPSSWIRIQTGKAALG